MREEAAVNVETTVIRAKSGWTVGSKETWTRIDEAPERVQRRETYRVIAQSFTSSLRKARAKEEHQSVVYIPGVFSAVAGSASWPNA